jgi:hypothetical protein
VGVKQPTLSEATVIAVGSGGLIIAVDNAGNEVRRLELSSGAPTWTSSVVPIGTTGSCDPGALTGNIREPSASTTTQSMRKFASISRGQHAF